MVKQVLCFSLCALMLAGCAPGSVVAVNGAKGRRVMYAAKKDDFGNEHPAHLRYYYEPFGYRHYYGGWYYNDPVWQNTPHGLDQYLPKRFI